MGGKNGIVLPTSKSSVSRAEIRKIGLGLGLLGAPVPGLPQRLARLEMAVERFRLIAGELGENAWQKMHG